MASLRFEKVSKVYPNGFEAFKDLSFTVEDGEFAILTGPSGRGKSAVVRMVAGMEPITGGEVWIGDQVINDVAPVDRGVAMIFQNCAVYPRLSVFENVALGLRLRGMPEDLVKNRVHETMELLNIQNLKDEKAKNISNLQHHRTAMARALILRPEVLLMDEPLLNLEESFHQQMWEELLGLHEKLGLTILYATRNLEEMKVLGKRKIII